MMRKGFPKEVILKSQLYRLSRYSTAGKKMEIGKGIPGRGRGLHQSGNARERSDF